MFGKTRITGHLNSGAVKPGPAALSAKMAADLQLERPQAPAANPEPAEIEPVAMLEVSTEPDPFAEFENQAAELLTKVEVADPVVETEPEPVTIHAKAEAPVAVQVEEFTQEPAIEPVKPSLPFPQVINEKPRMTGSYISNDLTITGNLTTNGDITIDGTVHGDIRATKAVIGECATILGEVAGDEIIIHGKVEGRVRGVKVLLNASAHVTGDIVHSTIALEAGAHFEGSVMRKANPYE